MPKLEGGETLYVSPELLKEKGIVLTKAQAKQLLKVDKPKKPRSQAQIDHINAVVQRNRERGLLRQKEKEEQMKQAEEAKKAVAIPIKVANKGKNNKQTSLVPIKRVQPPIEEEEEEEQEEDDLPPRGRGQASQREDDEDEPQRIQAVKKVSKKAKELMEEMEQIDEKINLLKGRPVNRYAHLLQF